MPKLYGRLKRKQKATKRKPRTIKLLDDSEVAEILKVQHQTFRLWHSNGKYPLPPFTMVGGRRRYQLADVLAWLDQRKESANA